MERIRCQPVAVRDSTEPLQAALRTFVLRNSHGAIKCNYGRGNRQQKIVKRNDFPPVQLHRAWRTGVNGSDAGLDVVLRQRLARRGEIQKSLSFRNKLSVPAAGLVPATNWDSRCDIRIRIHS
jgi:hypothetical protein